MPAADHQASIGRSILSIRRDLVHAAMDRSHDLSGQEAGLEAFQKQVAEQFMELSLAGPDEFLSLPWIRNLLDVFICCLEEFRIVLFNNKPYLGRPPMDRLIGEFYERTVKALDVCNAVRDGIEQIRQWQKLLEIVLTALDNHKCLGEGQTRRARKALIDLAIGMLDEKESTSALARRNRSFGRSNANAATASSTSKESNKNLGHFRSLSWSVSRTWSASRQLQAIGSNLSAPRGYDVSATNGLAVAVYTISCVLLLVMWTLVAAIPCQDRGLQTHFSIPRQFVWAAPLVSIHERILEESKKRERKNACGFLKEIYQTEKWARQMNELLDSLSFPLTGDKEAEVRHEVKEFGCVFESLKDGLEPLERQVREVFHRIVRSRTDCLDNWGMRTNVE
ncbi:hypothetical protein Nepgr_023411 [Nepenthes gracilis]|uniref:Uncharacterized protein n=1 Tax=Nepenthes gracilis TaxID=150966 RepID=A0AAD3XZ07_NEPGR|nr:hypothetical protein Nepgr_023411 [Nepenthes gracilis]